MANRRFLERKDIQRLIGQAPDFTLRWQGIQILLVGCALIISVVGLVLFLSYLRDGIPNPARDIPILLLLITSVGLSIAFHFCFSRITYMEFLCLLFASSARIDTEFLMILNRRGIVVYFDKNYEHLFATDKDAHDFQDFLAMDGISESNSQKLLQALMEREDASIPFSYTDDNGKKVKVEVTLTSLSRPKNYSVLKGIIK